MRGVFLSSCLSILQLKHSCLTRTPVERGISEFMFIYLTTKAFLSYQDNVERGISEFMFIYVTTKAFLSYKDTSSEGYI